MRLNKANKVRTVLDIEGQLSPKKTNKNEALYPQ